MNQHRPTQPRVVAATRRAPVRSLATVLAVALLLALTALVLARLVPSLAGARHVSSVVPGPGNPQVSLSPSNDTGVQHWNIQAPLPEPRVRMPRPAPPTTNWDALRVGIASATVASAPGAGVAAPRPADLAVAMTPAERARLIAAAREPEGLPRPEGYVPGIVVITHGASDGICR